MSTEHPWVEHEVQALVVVELRIPATIVRRFFKPRRPVRPAGQRVAVAGEHVVGDNGIRQVVRIRHHQFRRLAGSIVRVEREHQILHPERLQNNILVVVDVGRHVEHEVSVVVRETLDIPLALIDIAVAIYISGRVRPADERMAGTAQGVRHADAIPVALRGVVPRERHCVHLAIAAVRVERHVVTVQLPQRDDRDVGVRHRDRKLRLPADDLPARPPAVRRGNLLAISLLDGSVHVRRILHEGDGMPVQLPERLERAVKRPRHSRLLVVAVAEHERIKLEVQVLVVAVIPTPQVIILPFFHPRSPVRPTCQRMALKGEHVVGDNGFRHVIRIRHHQFGGLARAGVRVEREHQILHPVRLQDNILVVVDLRPNVEHEAPVAVFVDVLVARIVIRVLLNVTAQVNMPVRVLPAGERVALADQRVRDMDVIAKPLRPIVPRERHGVHRAIAAVHVEGHVERVRRQVRNEGDIVIRHGLRDFRLPADDLPCGIVAVRRIDRRSVFLLPRRIRRLGGIQLEGNRVDIPRPFGAQQGTPRSSVVERAEHPGRKLKTELAALVVVIRFNPDSLATGKGDD